MAAMLPAGSISALVFAGRFVGVVITLLAGSHRDGAWRRIFLSWLRAAIGAAAALRCAHGRSGRLHFHAHCAGADLRAHPLVRITLQHGAFAARDTSVVAPTLAMYAVQIPFFVVSRVFYRFVVAMRRTDLVFYCGAINLALDVVSTSF